MGLTAKLELFEVENYYLTMISYNTMYELLGPRFQAAVLSEAKLMDTYGPDAEPNLIRHIKLHLETLGILVWFGPPKFDLLLARERGMDLNEVAKTCTLLLKTGWGESALRSGFETYYYPLARRLNMPYGEGLGKVLVVKSLRLMEELGLAEVDWSGVKDIMPEAAHIGLDIRRDSFDPYLERS